MYMSYSMSYTWYDVTCNVGICKSKSTLRDTSYHIRRMTGWALSYCGMRVAGCALYHKVVLHCDVTPRYAVTSLRVTLSRDFSPEGHPAIRHIHVNNYACFTFLCVIVIGLPTSVSLLTSSVKRKYIGVMCVDAYFIVGHSCTFMISVFSCN